MDNAILYLLIAGISFLMTAVTVICSVMVGAWLMFKGKSASQSEPFLRRDTTPGAYSINVDKDEPEFPDQKDSNQEHVLKRTENFLKSLGGGK